MTSLPKSCKDFNECEASALDGRIRARVGAKLQPTARQVVQHGRLLGQLCLPDMLCIHIGSHWRSGHFMRAKAIPDGKFKRARGSAPSDVFNAGL